MLFSLPLLHRFWTGFGKFLISETLEQSRFTLLRHINARLAGGGHFAHNGNRPLLVAINQKNGDVLKVPSQAASSRRYRVELITAESGPSRLVRHRRLIRFPQLTMPLLAGCTPDHWEVSHTDEIVQRVDFDKRVDLVGITAMTFTLIDVIEPRVLPVLLKFQKGECGVVVRRPSWSVSLQLSARHGTQPGSRLSKSSGHKYRLKTPTGS